MFILIMMLSIGEPKDSVYLGAIKYTLQANQTFEHQFFNVHSIKSMDLYFPDPPYNKVEDTDMECYWSFQQIGLQDISTIKLNASDSFDSDLICMADCYLRQGNMLYSVDATYTMETDHVQSLALNSQGTILFYNDKTIQTFDTVELTASVEIYPDVFTQTLKVATIAIEHEDTETIYMCANGVVVFNKLHQVVAQVYHQAYYTHQEEGICRWLMMSNDYLFLVSDQVDVYDIGDPMNIYHLVTIDVAGDLYDLTNSTMAILMFQDQSIYIQQYSYHIEQSDVNITIIADGFITNEFTDRNIQFKLLNTDVAAITSQASVMLIQLKTTTHQKIRHNSTLMSSQHFLTPGNAIFVQQGAIQQITDGQLHVYTPTSQSYNLVCTAPNKEITQFYYGIIRSEEKCKQGKVEDRFKPLLIREEDPDVKCLYSFQLTLYLQKSSHQWTTEAISLITLFILLVLVFAAQQCRNNSRNQALNNLKKFEQLNKLNLQKEKIRITHDDEESGKPRDDMDSL